MPELPEVETSRRGIEPHIIKQTVSDVIIRQRQLRWPITASLKKQLTGQIIDRVDRRGKYLLLYTQAGCVIIHLGMSGSLRICPLNSSAEKHDHLDIVFTNKKILRLRDPRRFGCVLFTGKDPLQHKLLNSLGPEPLSSEFNAEYLHGATRNRKAAIKSIIMDSHIVVGVGNIYTNESLFKAGINPKRAANKISFQRYQILVEQIKLVLLAAIAQGGTTLRDFTREDGQAGYFQQALSVYGKHHQPCPQCQRPIQMIKQQQRATYYCPRCQS
ncbi:MAG: bifunctional DNA-formamidopyrimidine glycosylase/DNA-(apurinic or apyrimidinic site) lyase [Gammaproteobacteria bacterium]|nr:bifunctional DNA-formamidopyrimidine glycosylase/DNA-(apurinic or apyrimidinic site) lyase [Gammaproteobacteria bacterium]